MVLQELEGFSYVTALDHNMGYNTIKLDQDASKIVPSSFLGASILPQEINDEYGRFSRHTSQTQKRLVLNLKSKVEKVT